MSTQINIGDTVEIIDWSYMPEMNSHVTFTKSPIGIKGKVTDIQKYCFNYHDKFREKLTVVIQTETTSKLKLRVLVEGVKYLIPNHVTKKSVTDLKLGTYYQVWMNFAGNVTCDVCQVVLCVKGLGWKHKNGGIIEVNNSDFWEEIQPKNNPSKSVIGKMYKPDDGSWCVDVKTGKPYNFNRHQTFKIVSEPYIHTFDSSHGKLTEDFINLISDTGIIFRVLHLGKFVEEPIEEKIEFTFGEMFPKEGSAIMVYNKMADICERPNVWEYRVFSIFNGLPRISDIHRTYESVDSSDIWKYV